MDWQYNAYINYAILLHWKIKEKWKSENDSYIQEPESYKYADTK